MSLTLHYHPLASFCWKALIGLYELEIPFEKHLVDLGEPEARAAGPSARGVEQARAQLEAAYALLEEMLRDGPWAMGASVARARRSGTLPPHVSAL